MKLSTAAELGLRGILVVADLSEGQPVNLETICTTRDLPNALDRWEEIAGLVQGKRPAVFLDYDGTLTPIVERPELAVLTDDMRAAVKDGNDAKGLGGAEVVHRLPVATEDHLA